jgi:hypothetical protein
MRTNVLVKQFVVSLAILASVTGMGQVAMAHDHHDVSGALVTVDGLPVAEGTDGLDLAPDTYFRNHAIHFAAKTEKFAAGTQYRWNWEDDDPDSTGASASHTYKTNGTYKVALQTSTANDVWKTSTKVSVSVVTKPLDSHLLIVLGMLGLSVAVVLVGLVWVRTKRRES